MRRTSPRRPKSSWRHLHLEALEVRWPVSDSVGAALALGALTGLGAASDRGAALGSPTNPTPVTPGGRAGSTGRTAPAGPALPGAARGRLGAAKATTSAATLVDRKPVAQGAGSDLGLRASAPGASHQPIRLSHGPNMPVGSLASRPKGGSVGSAGLSRAAASPTVATARGTGAAATAAHAQAPGASSRPPASPGGATSPYAAGTRVYLKDGGNR
jgi:pilus assembly protein FimV